MIPRQSEKPKVVPNKYIPSSVQIVPNLSQLLQISSKLVSKLLQVVITNHVVSEFTSCSPKVDPSSPEIDKVVPEKSQERQESRLTLMS